jgi:hypothetical protein
MEAQLLCRSVIFSTTVWVCHILNYCVGLPCSQHSPTVTMFCVCRLVDKRLLHLQQQCPEAQLLYAFAIFTALTDSIKNLVLCLQACGWETASSTTTVPGGSTTVWVCHIHTTHRHFIYNNSAWRLNYCVCVLQACGWVTASSTTTVPGGSTTVSCVCRLVGGRLLYLQQQCLEAQLLCGRGGDYHVSPGPTHVPSGLFGIPVQGLPHRQGSSLQSRIIQLYSETSSLHWKSKLRNV